MVSVPVRNDVLGFAATAYETVPLPVPGEPEVTLSHEALLTAVQPQPDVVVTAAEPGPPGAVTLTVVGETVNAQGAAA